MSQKNKCYHIQCFSKNMNPYGKLNENFEN